MGAKHPPGSPKVDSGRGPQKNCSPVALKRVKKSPPAVKGQRNSPPVGEKGFPRPPAVKKAKKLVSPLAPGMSNRPRSSDDSLPTHG